MPTSLSSTLRWEAAIVAEYARLIGRVPGKFLRQALRDYGLRWTGQAPAWQAVNLSMRIVDDIADGERPLLGEFATFPELISRARQQVLASGPLDNTWFLALLDYAVASAERSERRTGETREAFVGLLEAMLVEYERRIERSLLSRQALIEIHAASSQHPYNLCLITFGSMNRATDTPLLPEFIGRMGVLRDLEHELRLGIINVPREALPDGVTADDLIAQPERIRQLPSVQVWVREEAEWGLQVSQQLFDNQLDPAGTRITRNQVALYLRYAQGHVRWSRQESTRS